MTIEERNKIVEENIGLVGYTIRKFYNAFKNDEDAYQVGYMALIKAVNAYYRKEYEISFSTFAVGYIRINIHKYFLSVFFHTNINEAALISAYKVYRKYKEEIDSGKNINNLPIADVDKTLILKHFIYELDSDSVLSLSKNNEEQSLIYIREDIRRIVYNSRTPNKSKCIYMDYVDLILNGYEELKINKILREKYNCTRQNIHSIIKGMNKRVVDSLSDDYV